VQTGGKPRLIPVIYMPAADMAQIVRDVYADRIAGAEASRGRPPSPEDFIRALRGGGRNNTRTQATGEIQKMTIGVDSRSNSLIVAAPEPLFNEVEQLVAALDDETILPEEAVQVISIKQANPELVQQALASIVGESAQMSSSSSSSSRTSSGGGTPGQPSAEDIQRRMEFFRAMRERMGGGGGPPGGFGGGGPPGGFGGFRGFGGGPPGGAPGGGAPSLQRAPSSRGGGRSRGR
jgi:hypothetical protein